MVQAALLSGQNLCWSYENNSWQTICVTSGTSTLHALQKQKRVKSRKTARTA